MTVSANNSLPLRPQIPESSIGESLNCGDLADRSPDFDLAALLQSIRVLSSTLDLEDLLQKLAQIVLTNSGAQACILALPDSTGVWQIDSLVTLDPDRLPATPLPQPLEDTGHYPANTICWVKNIRQPLAFDASRPLAIVDRYLLTYRPQSVFCVPILKQDRIFGVLYLEHSQASNLFDRDKQILITFLCAQAAIAIENTRLYLTAQASVANIQSQQTYLTTLLDNIPHMAWLKDEHRRFIAANRQLAEVAGASDPSELVGKNDFDFWPSDLAQAFQDDDLRVMESGCQKIVEEQITQPNGEHRWLETIKTPIRNSEGKITGTVGIALDITNRCQMAADLRQSQQQYQRLSDNIPGAIYQFRLAPDGQMSYQYISSGCQELFRVQPAAVMADSNCLLSLIHPDDLAEFDRIVRESASKMTFKLWEGRAILASGETIWIESASRPTLQADGAIVWDGVMLDVTDRKVAKQALLASQRQYQRLADNIPGVIYQFHLAPDGSTSIPYISSGCQELFGLAPATIVADLNSLLVLTHPDDLPSFRASVAKSAKELSFFDWKGRIILSDRMVKWIELASRPELQPDGAIVWDGVMLDITDRQVALQERQQAEIALRETNDRLATTNEELVCATKLKDEFLATMSHELRTPLNAILGMSECLTEGIFGEVNERQAKSIDTIHRSGQHLLSLINDILDVSKIAAGKLELEFASVPLQRLCDASLSFVRAQADRKQIAIDTHIPAQIGMLWIDERRMRQVAINLLSNAVKFTPKGGRITLTAEITAATDRAALERQDDREARQDWLRLSVIDTGIGIAPADRDRLFQPFVQIDSSLNRQYEGTGLGLALVKQMVELHGGYVTLESELGRGSCFSVYLPHSTGDRHYFSQPEPPDRYAVLSDRHESSSNPELIPTTAQTTILLAEDNPTNAITFMSYLNAKGYRTIAAKDGTEAIDLAIAHRPDLILMDIQMSGMDGIEAILHIRQDPLLRRMPIVALTALAMASDRQKCLNAGANECLVKPVKLKELNRTIQNCLELNWGEERETEEVCLQFFSSPTLF